MTFDSSKLVSVIKSRLPRRTQNMDFDTALSDFKTIAAELNTAVSFVNATNGKDPGTGSRIGAIIKRLFADKDPVGVFADRPRTLIFGNGIAGQSIRGVATPTTTVTSAADLKAGTKAIPLVVGGAALIGATAGSQFAITLCSGQPWIATVVSVATDVVTITQGLPMLVKASAGVSTLVGGFWPATYNQNAGLISAANALLGSPLDILPGHGHNGATGAQLLQNLEQYLTQLRPDVVIFHLWEQDINTATLAEITRQAKWAARQCQMFGAIPIFVSPVPSTGYTNVTLFDQVVTLVNTISTLVPGAYGIDASTQWLNTTTTTLRQPVAGWTDGMSPNPERRFSVALAGTNSVYKQLGNIVGARKSHADDSLWGVNTTVRNTGGTATNLAVGSVVAANTTITADAGVTCTTSKTALTDSQTVTWNIAGASNITSTRVKVLQAWTVPTTQAKGTYVKAVARFKINAAVNLSHAQLDLITNGTNAQTVSGFIAVGSLNDSNLIGKEIVIETSALPMLDASVTTLSAQLGLAPINGLTNQCSGSIELREIGFVIVPQHELAQ